MCLSVPLGVVGICGPVMAKHHRRKLIIGDYWVVKAFIHQLPTIQVYQTNLVSEQGPEKKAKGKVILYFDFILCQKLNYYLYHSLSREGSEKDKEETREEKEKMKMTAMTMGAERVPNSLAGS